MQTPHEIIARLRHECASSGFHDHDGCNCTDNDLLDRGGYRLVGPGELDAETIERCEDIAVGIKQDCKVIGNDNGAWAAECVARGIRALSQESKP